MGNKEYVFRERFERLKTIFILFLFGLAIFATGYFFFPHKLLKVFALFLFLCVPLPLYAYYVALVHWKDRYRGERSDDWAIAFVFTATNWGPILVLLYYFYHVIPDMRRVGNYKE